MALVAGVLLCGVSILLGIHGKTLLGRPLGGDFVEFYVIGKILNHYPAYRIYDLRLAVGLQHATLPTMNSTQMLVFSHAPYIVCLFRPFALLPYAWAYVSWLAFSGALYFVSLWMVFRAAELPREQWKTGFLLAASSTPFLFETWIGGQLSVLAFFAWALFFFCRHENRMFLAGIALSLALFKPTLVALPVAVLLFGRLWHVLSGVLAGAMALALVSIQTVGLAGCRAWIGTLVFDARVAAGPAEAWHLAKNVDMNAFFHLLFWNSPLLTGIAVGLLSVVMLALLLFAWSRSSSQPRSSQDLLWAATLCFSFLVNSYSPIYDTILLVGAVALIAGAMEDYSHADRAAFAIWLLLLYVLSWITQSFAQFLHFQLFTVVLAGFAVWILKLASRNGQLLPAWAAHRGTILASNS
jgi:Glycosyltransferase family 87